MIPSSVSISGYETNYHDMVGKYIALPSIPRSWETVFETNKCHDVPRFHKELVKWINSTIDLEGRFCIHYENKIKNEKWSHDIFVSFESDNDAISFVLLEGKLFISEKT